eukprot:1493207-Amphidinium_carterae.1
MIVHRSRRTRSHLLLLLLVSRGGRCMLVEGAPPLASSTPLSEDIAGGVPLETGLNQDDLAAGGLRDACASVRQLPLVQSAGFGVRNIVEDFFESDERFATELIAIVEGLGSDDAQGFSDECLCEVRRRFLRWHMSVL